MIQLNDLTVTYQNEVIALDHIDLKMDHKCTMIVGMNGSGKSTLLTSLVGLHPFTGSMSYNQLAIQLENMVEVRQKIGMVFQNPDDQLFMSTIYDDIAFGLLNMGIEPKEKVEAIAKAFDFEHLLTRSSHKLSGGQKRIAALLTVLVMDPEVILMDEPTSFLDPKSRRKVIEYIQQCKQDLIISTHDLDMAYEIGDEIILLNNGHLIAQGNPKEILTNQQLLEENGLELPFTFQTIK